MNVLKIALLGTAALAAVSVSAQANDLADMKAQIEALNSRIASLESSASVPAGFSLLSISEADAIIVPGYINDKGWSKKATTIGILPTADVPASTVVQWSGNVRAAIAYRNYDKDGADIAPVADNPATPLVNEAVVGDFDFDVYDVAAKFGLKVVGTTDTAVGEVGVRVAFVASADVAGGLNRSNTGLTSDGYWGWWKMTPELTLGGGVDGSLANSSNAFDNRCSCNLIDTGGAFGKGDPAQIRLSYASGPISFAVAVEDYNNVAVLGTSKSSLGLAGEVKWSGDAFGFDMSAGYWDTAAAGDADWTVNAGANMALGDMAKLGVAIGTGESGHVAGDKFTRGSMFLGFTLSDSVSAELGATYTDAAVDNLTVAGGLYYTPVSQLTLGLEASYSDNKGANETTKFGLLTKYSF